MSTYTPFASYIVSSSGSDSTVNFVNLPQDYVDFEVRIGGNITGGGNLTYSFNNDTSTIMPYYRIFGGTSGSGLSGRDNTATVSYANVSGFSNSAAIIYVGNYTNPNIFKSTICRTNNQTTYTGMYSTVYPTLNPITSMTITTTGTFDAGFSISLFGIQAGTPKAQGGNLVTTDGTYWYHTFTATGTFTPNQALSNVDFLVLAGGGGSGEFSAEQSGGGGAGGLRSSVSPTGGGGSAEAKLSFSANTTYTMTVGAGGARGSNGGDSSIAGTGFTTITSLGGGKGSPRSTAGGNGGSGGGGGDYSGAGGTGQSGQGFGGGSGTGDPAGSGGGAGGAGNSGSFTRGVGVSNSITGTAVTYGTGGSGGGTGSNGSASTANVGKGGDSGETLAYAGGSGVIIVRYAV